MTAKKLAIITARGGSKRIPGKNIKNFCGKPILCYSIEAAKDTYLNWQKTKIGRDINPDALIEFARAAGGKRVAIESPAFTPIPETSIAREKTVEFVYGGVEDD